MKRRQVKKNKLKQEFIKQLQSFAKSLNKYVSTTDNQWTIKGFIDIFENIYTITSDTKMISKIMEIHLFPKFIEFSKKYGYRLVFAEKQNRYPDITLISLGNDKIKFAVDLKTTYALDNEKCNGFTLGSHGEYFTNRKSKKNIQFPYGEYLGHYCLGIIYSRNIDSNIHNSKIYALKNLNNIPSVIGNFTFFANEKWRIASDKPGSGNTANIGSTKKINELLNGNGIFYKIFGEKGEKWFDDYWMNYGKITITDNKGNVKKITKLDEFLKYKNINRLIK